MNPRRVLITGINGLIGAILQKGLQERYEIYGLDRNGPFSDRILSADISDYEQLAKVLQQFRPLDAIIH